jgi:hypothetical protein
VVRRVKKIGQVSEIEWETGKETEELGTEHFNPD